MTALGAAAAAAMRAGWLDAAQWAARDVPGKRFEPRMQAATRAALLKGWDTALGRAL
jgi:glycerol kinase